MLEQDAAGHLRSALPDETASFSEDELCSLIRRSADRAYSYGLDTDDQILNFTAASLILGENFDRDPEHEWAAAILQDADSTADERAALLIAFALQIAEEMQEVA